MKKLMSLLALLLALTLITGALAEDVASAPVEAPATEVEAEIGAEAAPEVEAETAPVFTQAKGEKLLPHVKLEKSMTLPFWLENPFVLVDDYDYLGSAYKSSDSKIATVTSDGIVTCKKAGTVKITMTTAANEQRVLTLKVIGKKDVIGTIRSNPGNEQAIVSGDTATITTGETWFLVAADVNYEAVFTFKSSNTSVAEVEADSPYSAFITPKQRGTATITVTSPRTNKFTVTLKVVNPNEPQSIEGFEIINAGNGEDLSVALGKTAQAPQNGELQIRAILAPTGSSTTLKWKSSNAKVLKITEQNNEQYFCRATALKKGTVTLTCTTDNGLSAKVKISVVAQKITGIMTYDLADGASSTLASGKTFKAIAGSRIQFGEMLNFGAEAGTCKWKSSNSKVLRIDVSHQNEPIRWCQATALKAGTVTLTCTSSKLGKFSIKVKVSANKADKLSAKPDKTDMKNAGVDVWLKSLEYKADGTLVAQFYLLNGLKTLSYLDGLTLEVLGYDNTGHLALNAYQDFGNVKLNKSKKYANATITVTFKADNVQASVFKLSDYSYFNASASFTPR